jgi:uncharacterized membrane protein
MRRDGGAKALGAAGAVLAVVYPAMVYFGLSRLSARAFAVGMAVVLATGAALRLAHERREHALVAARIPLTIVAILVLGAIFDDRRFVLALPVLTNAALLSHFALSLRTMPIAERIARTYEDVLSPRQVAYCRNLTRTWCAFFITNGAVSAGLALWAPLAWWTLYTGVVSYALMGLLFAVEYVVRKARFQKFGDALIDRLLSRVLAVVPRTVEIRK